MKWIRRVLGTMIACIAALWALSGFICSFLALTGQLDTSGMGENLLLTLAFLALGAASLGVAKLGLRLRGRSEKHTPSAAPTADKAIPSPLKDQPDPTLTPQPLQLYRSPLFTCGPMGEQIVEDLKRMGLWDLMRFGEDKHLPMHPWLPSMCWYDKESIYHLQHSPHEVYYAGPSGDAFRWCYLQAAAIAYGLAVYPKAEDECSTEIVRRLSKVYDLDEPQLKTCMDSWRKRLEEHTGEKWSFSEEAMAFVGVRTFDSPVDKKEFDRIAQEESLSFTYVVADSEAALPSIRYDIDVRKYTVSVTVTDLGMARANTSLFCYATQQQALGRALQLMREYKQLSASRAGE